MRLHIQRSHKQLLLALNSADEPCAGGGNTGEVITSWLPILACLPLTAVDIPVDVPVDVPADVPGDVPADVPGDVPVDVDIPVDIAACLPRTGGKLDYV